MPGLSVATLTATVTPSITHTPVVTTTIKP
jgi:hypothetical protein